MDSGFDLAPCPRNQPNGGNTTFLMEEKYANGICNDCAT